MKQGKKTDDEVSTQLKGIELSEDLFRKTMTY